ncbi:MAG: 1-deoxy-D-xylulose-5-phosphate synthase [Halanaerobiales bacterium]|nr:1-deoxy-D-xylulose-5-phosphate synthase [Halanaerobiales bacterium]
MMELLDQVNTPGDLKAFTYKELDQLAGELRNFIITTVADTGGHLASNLGVVELTLALHYHLNSPKDKIIWDVGHQCYPHKILTGRKDKFHTIRQYGGLSGFPKNKESIHDIIETGHSSTSISSALGLVLARDIKRRNDKIYAVIGDGALTAGMAFEGLNHTGHLQSNLKVILNDNAMSISPNVGALSHYLSNIRLDPTVSKLKEDIEFLISRIPKIGTTVANSIERIKDGIKYILISGILFEEFGFTYVGPLDGHNIEELVSNFRNADRIDGPVLLHVITKKGKGYKPAEKQPSKFHGVSPFEIKNGESKKNNKALTFSEVFGHTMCKIGELEQKVVGITAAMPEGTGLNIFQDRFPERVFDVGIAEQHGVTLAAGLARGGLKPVVTLYSTFLQRAYDQVVHDVCIQNLPVTIAVDRCGIVGNDGETHQGVFDLAFLRPIPNLVIMSARDEKLLQQMLYTAVNSNRPTVVRYPRGDSSGVGLEQTMTEITLGRGEVLQEGKDLLIIAVGSRVYPALRAAELLSQQGLEVGVIDPRFIKPLDQDLLLENIKRYKKVISVEEHVLAGGFGSAILELINNYNLKGVQLKRLGLPDHFIPHGSQARMRALYQLDAQGIKNVALEMITGKVEIDLWPRRNA